MAKHVVFRSNPSEVPRPPPAPECPAAIGAGPACREAPGLRTGASASNLGTSVRRNEQKGQTNFRPTSAGWGLTDSLKATTQNTLGFPWHRKWPPNAISHAPRFPRPGSGQMSTSSALTGATVTVLSGAGAHGSGSQIPPSSGLRPRHLQASGPKPRNMHLYIEIYTYIIQEENNNIYYVYKNVFIYLCIYAMYRFSSFFAFSSLGFNLPLASWRSGIWENRGPIMAHEPSSSGPGPLPYPSPNWVNSIWPGQGSGRGGPSTNLCSKPFRPAPSGPVWLAVHLDAWRVPNANSQWQTPRMRHHVRSPNRGKTDSFQNLKQESEAQGPNHRFTPRIGELVQQSEPCGTDATLPGLHRRKRRTLAAQPAAPRWKRRWNTSPEFCAACNRATAGR